MKKLISIVIPEYSEQDNKEQNRSFIVHLQNLSYKRLWISKPLKMKRVNFEKNESPSNH